MSCGLTSELSVGWKKKVNFQFLWSPEAPSLFHCQDHSAKFLPTKILLPDAGKYKYFQWFSQRVNMFFKSFYMHMYFLIINKMDHPQQERESNYPGWISQNWPYLRTVSFFHEGYYSNPTLAQAHILFQNSHSTLSLDPSCVARLLPWSCTPCWPHLPHPGLL